MELLLSAIIDAPIRTKSVKSSDLKRVTVDTTVQEKAIAFSLGILIAGNLLSVFLMDFTAFLMVRFFSPASVVVRL